MARSSFGIWIRIRIDIQIHRLRIQALCRLVTSILRIYEAMLNFILPSTHRSVRGFCTVSRRLVKYFVETISTKTKRQTWISYPINLEVQYLRFKGSAPGKVERVALAARAQELELRVCGGLRRTNS